MPYAFSNSGQVAGALSPQTLSYTCASGVKLLVVCLAINAAARTGGTPTYNGVAMTQAGIKRSQGAQSAEIWFLVMPPTGSAYNISVPNTGVATVAIIASSYVGDPGFTYALDVTGGANGTTANPSNSVTTTVAGDVVIDVMSNGDNSIGTANNQTLLFWTDEGIWNSAAQYDIQAAAGAITFSYTVEADNWAHCIAAFKQVNRVRMVIGG